MGLTEHLHNYFFDVLIIVIYDTPYLACFYQIHFLKATRAEYFFHSRIRPVTFKKDKYIMKNFFSAKILFSKF